MNCPKHGVPLESTMTSFGRVWDCPRKDCDVAWWGAKRSTPADKRTRTLRKECHLRFDAMWRDAKGPFKGADRRARRRDGYRWMSHAMKLSKEKTHIGLFDADKCLRLLDLLSELDLFGVVLEAKSDA